MAGILHCTGNAEAHGFISQRGHSLKPSRVSRAAIANIGHQLANCCPAIGTLGLHAAPPLSERAGAGGRAGGRAVGCAWVRGCSEHGSKRQRPADWSGAASGKQHHKPNMAGALECAALGLFPGYGGGCTRWADHDWPVATEHRQPRTRCLARRSLAVFSEGFQRPSPLTRHQLTWT